MDGLFKIGITILTFFLISSTHLYADINGKITYADEGQIKIENLNNTVAFKMGETIELSYMAGLLEMQIGTYEVLFPGTDMVIGQELSVSIPPEKGMTVLVYRSSQKIIIDEPDPGAMLPPTEDPRFIQENMGGSKDTQMPVYNADIVAGEVIEVMETDVRIKLTSVGDVKAGYNADLIYVTSMGDEIPVGTWKVHTLNEHGVIASAINMEITPRIGVKAVLSPPKKKSKKSSFEESSPLEENANGKDVYSSHSDPQKSNSEQVAEIGDSQQDMKKANQLYNEIEKNQRVYSTQKMKNLQNQMIKHVRSAASRHNPKANYWLAMMYEDGFGDIKADSKQMVKYLIAAGKLGYIDAQFLLGEMYEDGDEVIRHKSKAIYWYKKAAKQGHTESKKQLEELQ